MSKPYQGVKTNCRVTIERVHQQGNVLTISNTIGEYKNFREPTSELGVFNATLQF